MSFQEDIADFARVAGRGGYVYASRADWLAANIPAPVLRSGWMSDGSAVSVARKVGGDIGQANGDEWVPEGVTHLEHFADITTADCAVAWEAAMDYLEGVGGGELRLVYGQVYLSTAITIASNVTVNVNGATLGPHSDMPLTGGWLQNRDVNATTSGRTCERPQIIGPGTLDGYARPFVRWLSKADGTLVTDPEADYVMGSGALASGISGVSLTAVLTGDAVTSVTINNGGSGWNSHPTFPYLPTTVLLRFEGGGGHGARGFGTISGGTITSVTIVSGGADYTSPPVVTSRGGYADIALLADPSIDRRNPAYEDTGTGITFAKANSPRIEGLVIKGFRGRTVLDQGSYNGIISRCSFVDCGKNDGPFHAVWAQSYGSPTGGETFYAPTENILIENCQFLDCERSAMQFAPTKGGTVRNVTASGCGEATIFVPSVVCYDGGAALIEGCDLSDNVLADIAGHLIETNSPKNLTIRGNLLRGASDLSLALVGSVNCKVLDNRIENSGTAITTTGDQRTPYGPYSERYDFNSGARPTAGQSIFVPALSSCAIGSLGAVGGKGLIIRGNVFSETRTEYPLSLFAQTKSGSSSIAGSTLIAENDVSGLPADVQFLDTTVSTVWLPIMPLRIRDNIGHASEAPVIVPYQVSATGLINITCGFRPSSVHVMANVNNGARLRSSHGAFSWTRSGVRNDFVHNFSTNDTTERGAILDLDVLRITDEAGTPTVIIEFSSWTETGFVLNCGTYSELTNIRFVCHP